MIKKVSIYIVSLLIVASSIFVLFDSVSRENSLSSIFYITKPSNVNKPQQKYYPCDGGVKVNPTTVNMGLSSSEGNSDSNNTDCSRVVVGCMVEDACNYNKNANTAGDCRFAVKEIILFADKKGQETGRGSVHIWQTDSRGNKLWNEYYSLGSNVSISEAGKNACDYEVKKGVKARDLVHEDASKPSFDGGFWRKIFN